MQQEPGTNEEVKEFAQKLYGAEFLLFSKTDVNGPNSCEAFKYLRINSELNDKKKKEVKEIPWNFAKFIVNSEGKVLSYHNPRTEPVALIPDIEKCLGLK